MTSWGFHASLVADADAPEMRSTGTEKFQAAAKQNLTPPLHAYRGTISIVRPESTVWEEIEDTNDEGHFYFVVTGYPTPSLLLQSAPRPMGRMGFSGLSISVLEMWRVQRG